MKSSIITIIATSGTRFLIIALSLGVFIISSCSDTCPGSKETTSKDTGSNTELSQMPYKRIPAGDEDPGENGPDDSTEINGVPWSMGKVKFTHFTHSSNSKAGYGIPCQACHHNVDDDDDSSGCSECHKSPIIEEDFAHAGPDDNMILTSENQTKSPVAFNHFTHASAKGYKLSCVSCHHTSDLIACENCHGKVATMDDGNIVPKNKRAFHAKCKGCHEALLQNNPQSSAPVTCIECHKTDSIAKTGGKLSLERALHINCIDCHQKVKAAKPTANAPTRNCVGCHLDGYAKIPQNKLPTSAKLEEAKVTSAVEEEKAEVDAGLNNELNNELNNDSDAGTLTETNDASVDYEQVKMPKMVMITLGQKSKPPTPFNHASHQDYAEGCKSCHHQGMDEPTCSGCHDASEAKKIYHKQCIECHKENGASTSCSFCHPK